MSSPSSRQRRTITRSCMRETLSAAEMLARQRGLRFTPTRRRVLEIIAGQPPADGRL